MQAGFGYVADEVCAIDLATMTARPYPRPIGLRPAGAAALGIEVEPGTPWRPPVLHGPEPVAFGAVVLVERRPGPPKLTVLSPADALHQIADHSLGDAGVERTSFRRLETLVRSVQVVVAVYESAPHAAELVRNWMNSGSPGNRDRFLRYGDVTPST